MKKYSPISSYDKSIFAANTRNGDQIQHDVYTLGKGAPIIIIQELPGISEETLKLADRLMAKKFQVILPHLFGQLEAERPIRNLYRVFCMRKEFHCFTTKQSSPIVDWLKALCRKVKEEKNAKGVGVIGMCLTGNFAISLMADDSVLAAVSSQPSLPFGSPSALHMSDKEIDEVKTKLDRVGPMMALRFEKDKPWLCSVKKFNCIEKTFNADGKERIKLKEMPGKGHSVLTGDFVNEEGHPTYEAFQEVLGYFSGQLK